MPEHLQDTPDHTPPEGGKGEQEELRGPAALQQLRETNSAFMSPEKQQEKKIGWLRRTLIGDAETFGGFIRQEFGPGGSARKRILLGNVGSPEITLAAVRGAIKGVVTEPLDAVGDLAGLIGFDAANDFLDKPGEFLDAIIEPPDSGVGKFVEVIASFITPFSLLGKITLAGKVINTIGKGGNIFRKGKRIQGALRIAQEAARGVPVDVLSIAPGENFANMVEEMNIPLVSAAAASISVDDSDSAVTTRLKMAGEGLILGPSLDIFVSLGIAAKSARRAHNLMLDSRSILEGRKGKTLGSLTWGEEGPFFDIQGGKGGTLSWEDMPVKVRDEVLQTQKALEFASEMSEAVTAADRRAVYVKHGKEPLDGPFGVSPLFDDTDNIRGWSPDVLDEGATVLGLDGVTITQREFLSNAYKNLHPSLKDRVWNSPENAIDFLAPINRQWKALQTRSVGVGLTAGTQKGAADINKLFEGAVTFKDGQRIKKGLEGIDLNISLADSAEDVVKTARQLEDALVVKLTAKLAQGDTKTTHQDLLQIALEVSGFLPNDRKALLALVGESADMAVALAARAVVSKAILSSIENQLKAISKQMSRASPDIAELWLQGHADTSLFHYLDVADQFRRMRYGIGQALNALDRPFKAIDEAAKSGGGTTPQQILRDLDRSLLETPIREGAPRAGEAFESGERMFGENSFRSFLEQTTPKQRAGLMSLIEMDMVLRDYDAVLDAARVTRHARGTDKPVEFIMNSMLGNLKTDVVVLTSGQSISLLEATGDMLGGLMGAAFREPGAYKQFIRGTNTLFGLVRYSIDGIVAAGRSVRMGHSLIDPQPINKAIGSLPEGAGSIRRGINKVGKPFGVAVRVPGQAIQVMDELTRNQNYRAYTRARALERGAELGKTGKDLSEFASNAVAGSYDNVTGVALFQEPLDYSRVPALASPLGGGDVPAMRGFSSEGPVVHSVKKLQEIANFPGFRGFRIIVPFMKTGVNFMGYSSRITPGLGFALKSSGTGGGFRGIGRGLANVASFGKFGGEIVDPDAFRRTVAQQGITGSILIWSATEHAKGNFTGGGPRNPAMREQWLKNNQPYSIRIGGEYNKFTGQMDGGKWLRYDRIEPFSLPMMLLADGLDTFSEASKEVEQKFTDDMLFLATAVAEGISSKSFFIGPIEFLEAWTSGDEGKLARLLESQARTAIPPIIRTGIKVVKPDPVLREARDVMERLQRQIPGLSSTLPPRYDMFGNMKVRQVSPIQRFSNPFSTVPVERHIVAAELMKADRGMSPPTPTLLGGSIDLRDMPVDTDDPKKGSLYDRWMTLLREGGRRFDPMEDELREVIRSKEYTEALGDSEMNPGGIKYKMLAERKRDVQEAAFEQMVREHPDFMSSLKKAQRQLSRLRQGDPNAPSTRTSFNQTFSRLLDP